ncbi:MAG: hypothetical protein M3M96_00695 [Candidatus Eremiobacteraeota bacterium]|nr:hypothetical protein [Candidatus Eremiobacteraeota bacterium]
MAKSAARFAHQSEEELSQLLDFYRVNWQYEPRSFAIAWDAQGATLESFTPDFYLPDFDLYLELTVIHPRLQTRKNRKVRLLRAAHPAVNIKLFNKRDISRLFSTKVARAS